MMNFMHYYIFGNFGNNTIAAIQWAHEQQLKNVTICYVDTGWGAECWHSRVQKGNDLVRKYGFESIRLTPPKTFQEQIIDRGAFPSAKFQWCAAFLKGMAFSAWADVHDPSSQATVIMGSRRVDSRARFDLPEFDEHNEYFGGRRVWYPLYSTDDAARNKLITRAGFDVLAHRSLECLPCVHNSEIDLSQMTKADRERVSSVEKTINSRIISGPSKENSLENFDMGCGSKYGCGE